MSFPGHRRWQVELAGQAQQRPVGARTQLEVRPDESDGHAIQQHAHGKGPLGRGGACCRESQSRKRERTGVGGVHGSLRQQDACLGQSPQIPQQPSAGAVAQVAQAMAWASCRTQLVTMSREFGPPRLALGPRGNEPQPRSMPAPASSSRVAWLVRSPSTSRPAAGNTTRALAGSLSAAALANTSCTTWARASSRP